MSRQVLWILLLVPFAAMGQALSPDDRTRALAEHARQLVAVDADGCLLHRTNDEIVVCGMSEADRQQRLPFPELAVDVGKRIRDPIPNGNPEIVQQGRCYVTMNERNCFKGVPIVSVSFGGAGGGVGGAAGRVWSAVTPDVPEADYVRQAMVRPLAPVPID